ncbi:HAD family hydrolase [Streptomyces scopuliridis]|uniref:HAD family hydrolase n=1 Tax=Streptomyces scopuliridis TaxID=452529 RepID=UPI0035E32344
METCAPGGREAQPFAAAIFDFDGVVIDSIGPDRLACEALFREYGERLPVTWWAARVCGRPDGYEQLFNRIIVLASSRHRAVPVAPTPDSLRQRLAQLWAEYLTESHIRLLPAVQELLATLHAADLRLAVASASNRSWVSRWLHHYDLARYFGTIVTSDDVRHRKPHPEVYHEAMRRLGVRPDGCVAFEDSLAGITAARAAGATVVAVPTDSTRFLDHSAADAVVDDLSAVSLDWLAGIGRERA